MAGGRPGTTRGTISVLTMHENTLPKRPEEEGVSKQNKPILLRLPEIKNKLGPGERNEVGPGDNSNSGTRYRCGGPLVSGRHHSN